MKKKIKSVIICAAIFSSSILLSCKSESEKEFEKLKEEHIVFTESDLTKALIDAINSNQEILVKRLLFAGADPNSTDENGNSALWLACNIENNSIVDAVLASKPDVNKINEGKVTPLSLAISQGNVLLVDKLIKAGTNLKLIGDDGLSPLASASAMGHSDIVEKILASGIEPIIHGDSGTEPICLALENGHVKTFVTLLQAIRAAYKEIPEETQKAITRSMSTAIRNGNQEMVTLLLNEGFMPDPSSGSLIKQAVISGHSSIIATAVSFSKELNPNDPWVSVAICLSERHKLVEEGILSSKGMLNTKTKKPEWTAIMRMALQNAISKNDTILVQRLLKAGAPSHASNTGAEVLEAIRVDNAEILKMLYEAGAPLDEIQREHALGIAANFNAIKCLEYMLSLDIHPDTTAPADNGQTPLRRAVLNKSVEAATILVNKGADVNHMSAEEDAEPIAFLAINVNNLALLELLLKNGVYPDTYIYHTGETLLMRAAQRSTAAIVELLINYGANPNEVNALGASPVMYSAMGLNLATLKMLESKGADLKHKKEYNVGGVGTMICDASAISYHAAGNIYTGKAATAFYSYLVQKGAAREGRPARNVGIFSTPEALLVNGFSLDRERKTAAINHERMQKKRFSQLEQNATQAPDNSMADTKNVDTSKESSPSPDSEKSQQITTSPESAEMPTSATLAASNEEQSATTASEPVETTAPEAQGATATGLHEAVKAGKPSLVKAALAQTTNLEIRDAEDHTALMVAALEDRSTSARLLIQAGADVNAKSQQYGTSVLMMAAMKGYHEVVAELLAAGAKVNETNKSKFTALMLAARGNHKTVIQQLLNAGARKDMKDSSGKKAVEHATSSDVKRLLR